MFFRELSFISEVLYFQGIASSAKCGYQTIAIISWIHLAVKRKKSNGFNGGKSDLRNRAWEVLNCSNPCTNVQSEHFTVAVPSCISWIFLDVKYKENLLFSSLQYSLLKSVRSAFPFVWTYCKRNQGDS